MNVILIDRQVINDMVEAIWNTFDKKDVEYEIMIREILDKQFSPFFNKKVTQDSLYLYMNKLILNYTKSGFITSS